MLHARIVTDDEERRQQVVDEIFGKHDEGIGRSSRCTSVDRDRESDDEGMDDEVEQGGMFDFILSKMSDKRRKVSRNAHTFSTGATKAYSSLPTIVYVWRRDEAESLADYLKSQEVSAAAYHAGMERSQRARVQLMFNKGTVNVVVATVAFGMGIDKSNVRRVIHASLPKSVENYVQVIYMNEDELSSRRYLLHNNLLPLNGISDSCGTGSGESRQRRRPCKVHSVAIPGGRHSSALFVPLAIPGDIADFVPLTAHFHSEKKQCRGFGWRGHSV